MNICIFDTETVSLEKPFCYNVGYIIANTETQEVLLRREFVVEQIWSNAELFTTAYYAAKREIYVGRMRARKILMRKWGYITQQMIRDFESYEITQAYAYNSGFDEKVFAFCCEWFKVINPFESVEVFDIRAYVHNFIAFMDEFKNFCEEHARFTENGNYSTTAETLFQFITNNEEFEEEHTALADSEIEMQILFDCVQRGAEFGKVYKVYQSIPREVERELYIVKDGEETVFTYRKRINRGDKIFLK